MNRPVSGLREMDENVVGVATVTLPDGHHCRGSAWLFLPVGRSGFGVFTVCFGDPRRVVELGQPVTLTFDSGRKARIIGREADIIRLHFVVGGEAAL